MGSTGCSLAVVWRPTPVLLHCLGYSVAVAWKPTPVSHHCLRYNVAMVWRPTPVCDDVGLHVLGCRFDILGTNCSLSHSIVSDIVWLWFGGLCLSRSIVSDIVWLWFGGLHMSHSIVSVSGLIVC